ncbi:MAG: hypothetical protein QF492_01570 [Candidatus Krumholzibacteria bacterium]|jgi:hypothetical protein|nr:hypothetical protein [Candidatus Krumholzibacteria bacterium]MDP6668582.1 hypothetical protein [Candidatus Krumholzibacteria bacterium]MDP6796843.1 hypothetical protein [Candidatus Krumholzibacteria bacterium]MDP7021349.1 hypothetical protein [Candidatus Krumholzibacteria bacterium]
MSPARLFLSALSALLLLAGVAQGQDSTIHVIEVRIDDSGIVINEDGRCVEVSADTGLGLCERKVIVACDEEDEKLFFREDVRIGAEEHYLEDLVVLFGDLDLEGFLGGDVVVLGGDVRLHGGAEIAGDLLCIGGQVEQDSTATIHGDEAVLESRSLFSGAAWRALLDEEGCEGFSFEEEDTFFSADGFGLLLGLLILVFLLQLFFRSPLSRAASALREKPGRSFFQGILGLLLIVLLMPPFLLGMILLMSLLAVLLFPVPWLLIPVLLLLILFIVILLIALVFLPMLMPVFALSRYVLEKRGWNVWLSLLLLVLSVWLLTGILVSMGSVGEGVLILLQLLVYFLGLGALFHSRIGRREILPGE